LNRQDLRSVRKKSTIYVLSICNLFARTNREW